MNLAGTGFSGSDLTGADLETANATGASFRQANLTNARLRGANLTGALLDEATMSGADLGGAIILAAGLNNVTQRGFTSRQLYSTASYAGGDLPCDPARRELPERMGFRWQEPGQRQLLGIDAHRGQFPQRESHADFFH